MEQHQKDALTGLPQRRLLEELRPRFSSRDDGSIWTVMMVDIDHFKLINDIYGHLSGDQVLRRIGQLLRDSMRLEDYVVRFGGDEFLAVFPGTERFRALNFAQRVSEELESAVFQRGLKVTLSVGIAESRPGERALDELIERSDRALYQAKEAGRGRIHFFEERSAGPELSQEISFGHFVGRQQQLRELRQLLDESLSGGSRFALIMGEAGVGKSRLAMELRHYAEFRQCRIAEGGCHEFVESEPYALLTTPVASMLQALGQDRLERLAAAVGQVHPATLEIFPGMPFQISEASAFFSEQRLRFRIFEDVARIVAALADNAPLLFILDDLQWAPDPDMEMLSHAVRSSASLPVLFVATMRTPVEDYPSVERYVSGVFEKAVPFLRVNLSNLTGHEAGNLVMFALHDPNIPEDVLSLLHRQSGGNPFFLRELIRTLAHDGSIAPRKTGGWNYRTTADLELPDSLTKLISSRISQLDEKSRKIIRIAALCEGEFPFDLLCQASELPEMEVAEALEAPLRMGLIQESLREAGLPVCSFTHDTVRSFLHRDLPGSMRSVLHARMGEYYERQYLS
ncbi:diguanylate cyclase, partial [Candidatus Fermentibacterales bacterium]|nr:diguanylate cyclase [Candidatus Fermentibacterales bacterium]